jgi:hypothetical protein
MINEANEPSSACRLWRLCQVETSTPPNGTSIFAQLRLPVKRCVMPLTSAQFLDYKRAIAVVNLNFIRHRQRKE